MPVTNATVRKLYSRMELIPLDPESLFAGLDLVQQSVTEQV